MPEEGYLMRPEVHLTQEVMLAQRVRIPNRTEVRWLAGEGGAFQGQIGMVP